MGKQWIPKRKEGGKRKPPFQSCLTLSLTRFSTSSASSMAAISLWYWLSVFFLVSRSHSAVRATIFRSYSSWISFSSNRNCFLNTTPILLSTWGESWPLLVRFFSRRAMISLLIWVRQASRSESARFRVAISNLGNTEVKRIPLHQIATETKVPQSAEVFQLCVGKVFLFSFSLLFSSSTPTSYKTTVNKVAESYLIKFQPCWKWHGI